MRKGKYLLPFFLGFVIAFAACKKEEEESCTAEDISDSCPADVSAIATFCAGTSDSDPSYYTYNGETYYCEGVEVNSCTNALQAIGVKQIEQGCSAKSAAVESKLSAMAENLLIKVKSQSLCD